MGFGLGIGCFGRGGVEEMDWGFVMRGYDLDGRWGKAGGVLLLRAGGMRESVWACRGRGGVRWAMA